MKKFKEWKTLVGNQTDKKLKLRTDNVLKFCNKKFADLYSMCGITRHKIVRFNPQQNGVVEGMNRTIMNKVRCLIISSGIPKPFW